jgi:hypothetical protein
MNNENESIWEKMKTSDSYEYINETDPSFRDNDDFRTSEIFWLSNLQVDIILKHEEFTDYGINFGVNRKGETFVKLNEGVVKIIEKQ